jgi:hypothetical protein
MSKTIFDNQNEEKLRSKSELEQNIMKEDIERAKEVSMTIGRGITKSVVYPIGAVFTFPTLFRKAKDYDNTKGSVGDGNFAKGWTIAGEILGSLGMYTTLALTNPKLILPVVLTQIGTNLASGYCEWQKSVKKRAEERRYF